MSDFTPAPKSGPSALKIILIVLAVIAALVIGAVGLVTYGCYHVAHSLVHKDGDKTTITIPGTGGTISENAGGKYSAAELGIDLYPGSTPLRGGNSADGPDMTMTTAIFSTPDPVSKVEAFYKDRIGRDGSDTPLGDSAFLSKKVSDKEDVTITLSSKSDEDGKTKIVIMHTIKKK